MDKAAKQEAMLRKARIDLDEQNEQKLRCVHGQGHRGRDCEADVVEV